MRKFLAGLFLLLISLPPVSLANEDETIPYALRMPYRIVRGVANLGLGCMEFRGHII